MALIALATRATLPQLIAFQLQSNELESTIGALLSDRVFHFTSGEKLKSILQSECILPNPGSLSKTSIHSDQSVGKHLSAVCLFD